MTGMAWLTLGLRVCPYLDLLACLGACYNMWHLWTLRRVVPGFTPHLVGLTIVTSWLALIDLFTPHPLITGPTVMAMVRFVGLRCLLIGFESWAVWEIARVQWREYRRLW